MKTQECHLQFDTRRMYQVTKSTIALLGQISRRRSGGGRLAWASRAACSAESFPNDVPSKGCGQEDVFLPFRKDLGLGSCSRLSDETQGPVSQKRLDKSHYQEGHQLC